MHILMLERLQTYLQVGYDLFSIDASFKGRIHAVVGKRADPKIGQDRFLPAEQAEQGALYPGRCPCVHLQKGSYNKQEEIFTIHTI